MTPNFAGCVFCKSEDNNYLVAGNICNAFVVGEIGSSDDFWIIGAEPEEESPYPLLSGNFLDSEGKVLFRLLKNMLMVNPGDCSLILADHSGYEIHDSAGEPILSVRTVFEALPGDTDESFITTITANCHNKDGQRVFWTEPGEGMSVPTKSVFGFNGNAFGAVHGMTETERELAKFALTSRGETYELFTRNVSGGEIEADGKVFKDTTISNARINVTTGNFRQIGKCVWQDCTFEFQGPAENVFNIINAVNKGKPKEICLVGGRPGLAGRVFPIQGKAGLDAGGLGGPPLCFGGKTRAPISMV